MLRGTCTKLTCPRQMAVITLSVEFILQNLHKIPKFKVHAAWFMVEFKLKTSYNQLSCGFHSWWRVYLGAFSFCLVSQYIRFM